MKARRNDKALQVRRQNVCLLANENDKVEIKMSMSNKYIILNIWEMY